MKTKLMIKVFILSVLVIMVLGPWTPVFSQDEVRMEPTAYDTLRRPAAVFDHDEHNEKAGLDDCAVCHHVWENGKLVEDESSEDSPCSDCHGLTSDQNNSMSLTNAYHTQCRTCHIDAGKGPLLCGQCHRKMKGGENE